MTTTATCPAFELRLKPVPASIRDARHLFAAWLDDCGVPDRIADDLLTAVSELCTNGLRAARSSVSLRAHLDGDSVIAEVRDDGPGFGMDLPLEAPDPLADRGRGLYVVQQLVDVLWVSPDDTTGGTVARIGRRINAD